MPLGVLPKFSGIQTHANEANWHLLPWPGRGNLCLPLQSSDKQPALTPDSTIHYLRHHPCFVLLLARPWVHVDIGAGGTRVDNNAVLKRETKVKIPFNGHDFDFIYTTPKTNSPNVSLEGPLSLAELDLPPWTPTPSTYICRYTHLDDLKACGSSGFSHSSPLDVFRERKHCSFLPKSQIALHSKARARACVGVLCLYLSAVLFCRPGVLDYSNSHKSCNAGQKQQHHYCYATLVACFLFRAHFLLGFGERKSSCGFH